MEQFLELAQSAVGDCRNYLDPQSTRPERLRAQNVLLARLQRRAALDPAALAGCVGLVPPGIPAQPTPGIQAAAALLQRRHRWSREQIAFDGLAGSGDFGAALQQIDPEAPRQVGCEVSLRLALAGLRVGRLTLWSDLRSSLIRERIADYALASHGLYRVDAAERPAFVSGLTRRLRSGGSLLLVDFEEGTASCRWHTEFVDSYRGGGHPFRHFTAAGLPALLRQAGLVAVEEQPIFDPLVIRAQPGEPDASLRVRFARRLVEVYALDRLRALDEHGALRIAERVEPYFRIALPATLAGHPYACERLTLHEAEGVRCLIAPRLAIAAIGTRP